MRVKKITSKICIFAMLLLGSLISASSQIENTAEAVNAPIPAQTTKAAISVGVVHTMTVNVLNARGMVAAGTAFYKQVYVYLGDNVQFQNTYKWNNAGKRFAGVGICGYNSNPGGPGMDPCPNGNPATPLEAEGEVGEANFQRPTGGNFISTPNAGTYYINSNYTANRLGHFRITPAYQLEGKSPVAKRGAIELYVINRPQDPTVVSTNLQYYNATIAQGTALPTNDWYPVCTPIWPYISCVRTSTGSLPPGVGYTLSGVHIYLSGAPNKIGTYNWTNTITMSGGGYSRTATTTYKMQVVANKLAKIAISNAQNSITRPINDTLAGSTFTVTATDIANLPISAPSVSWKVEKCTGAALDQSSCSSKATSTAAIKFSGNTIQIAKTVPVGYYEITALTGNIVSNALRILVQGVPVFFDAAGGVIPNISDTNSNGSLTDETATFQYSGQIGVAQDITIPINVYPGLTDFTANTILVDPIETPGQAQMNGINRFHLVGGKLTFKTNQIEPSAAQAAKYKYLVRVENALGKSNNIIIEYIAFNIIAPKIVFEKTAYNFELTKSNEANTLELPFSAFDNRGREIIDPVVSWSSNNPDIMFNGNNISFKTPGKKVVTATGYFDGVKTQSHFEIEVFKRPVFENINITGKKVGDYIDITPKYSAYPMKLESIECYDMVSSTSFPSFKNFRLIGTLGVATNQTAHCVAKNAVGLGEPFEIRFDVTQTPKFSDFSKTYLSGAKISEKLPYSAFPQELTSISCEKMPKGLSLSSKAVLSGSLMQSGNYSATCSGKNRAGIGNKFKINLSIVDKNNSTINSPSISEKNSKTFKITDVKSSNKHIDNIVWLYKSGFTSGCQSSEKNNVITTRYCPSSAVNRGSMATFLSNTLTSLEVDLKTSPFRDISENVHERGINWLWSSGIAKGVTKNSYTPKNKVTRGAMAEFLYRAAGSPKFSPTKAQKKEFKDVSKLTAYRQKAICWLKYTKITSGVSKNSYAPTKPVTRSQMATFIRKFVDKFGA